MMESHGRPTETIEDYLQLIYTMQREGLVSLGRGHRIELSDQGTELAESIIRRHMLAERLLTDILKLDWADVHDEAHKMEHAISPLIEKQILTLLDSPETCPHGNPDRKSTR